MYCFVIYEYSLAHDIAHRSIKKHLTSQTLVYFLNGEFIKPCCFVFIKASDVIKVRTIQTLESQNKSS